MPPPKLPTFGRDHSRETTSAFDQVVAYASSLEGRIIALEKQLAALQARILTLDQINVGLSANGARPLNLSGLVGSSGIPL